MSDGAPGVSGDEPDDEPGPPLEQVDGMGDDALPKPAPKRRRVPRG